MKLVIVESPAKAKTIEKYLGPGHVVKASKGHVVDLPKSGLAVDVQNKYHPTYVITKRAVVSELKTALKKAGTLVLAVDPDREGEAIGWHIARELKVINAAGKVVDKKRKLERIVFTEITKQAIQNAIQEPRSIDMNLVNAQQARRILDRLVGYELSPLLWKKIRYGLSAGRVQSVAVRLVVDREAERDAFQSEEYWQLKAEVGKEKQATKVDFLTRTEGAQGDETGNKEESAELLFELVKIEGKKPELSSKAEIEKVISLVRKAEWCVAGIDHEEVKKNPPPPFATSTLQQTAVNKLGFSAKRTMQAAQKLYEAGNITYMRTDSLHFSAQALTEIRNYIQTSFGSNYLPGKPNFYRTRAKVAQEAHEAIRPTDPTKSVESLGLRGDEAKLYQLIWSRALASQMLPARISAETVRLEVAAHTFQAIGKKVIFPGYLRVYRDQITERTLPQFTKGEVVYPHRLLGEQHFTQSPARYTEASLIKELERLGIGRPSTYAPIIQIIQQRKYVEKDGRYFIPTDTGVVVNSLLVKYFPEIVDVNFTAGMEDQLDTVANGKLDWVRMLDEFHKPFAKKLVENDKNIDREEFTVLETSKEKCPKCGKTMVVKLGRYGKFLSCSGFPKCDGMLALNGKEGKEMKVDVTSEEFASMYEPAPKTADGRDYLLKKGRFGEFWAHPDYPKVKDAKPLVLRPEKFRETYGEAPKTEDGRDYLLKKGRFGEFWAHPDYPKVKSIIRLKKRS